MRAVAGGDHAPPRVRTAAARAARAPRRARPAGGHRRWTVRRRLHRIRTAIASQSAHRIQVAQSCATRTHRRYGGVDALRALRPSRPTSARGRRSRPGARRLIEPMADLASLDAALRVRLRRRRDVRARRRARTTPRTPRESPPRRLALARPRPERHPLRVAASTAHAGPRVLAPRHLLAAPAAAAAGADRAPARRARRSTSAGRTTRRTSGSCSRPRLVCLVLAIAISEGARRRRDARLLLIGLAFVVSAGFLGLHALATPGVALVGAERRLRARDAGRARALAGCLAAASAIEYRLETSLWIVRHGRLLLGLVLAADRRAGRWSRSPRCRRCSDAHHARRTSRRRSPRSAAAGVVAYAYAAFAYFRIYYRRRSGLAFAVAFAFALLAEALVVAVLSLATSWQLSWWEWHGLMVVGVPRDRRRRLARVERGALQRALPRRDAARPQGGHASSSPTSPGSRRSPRRTARPTCTRCSSPTSAGSRR